VPGYECESWNGCWRPGHSAEIVLRCDRVAAMVRDPRSSNADRRLLARSCDTPAEVPTAAAPGEIATWSKLAKDANTKLQ